MKKRLVFPMSLLFCFVILSQIPACVHEPVQPLEPTPQDSIIVPVDTTILPPVDTLDSTSHPCDPDTVYFERDILPVLISNCAKSGCHDAASAKDGVILNNYTNVFTTGDIEPGDPEDSELYEAITEDEQDELMPPPPNVPLTQTQKDLIKKWILQGAQDLSCGDSSNIATCDTVDISYSLDLVPILDTHCIGCHQGQNPSGGVSLQNYAGVAQAAAGGNLYGAIAHLAGYSFMPQGTDPLPDCAIAQFKAWIDQGSLDN